MYAGDVLNALKTNMADPNNVLQSWDATFVNPCGRLLTDLQNANLSGQLVPQLGQLPNLQYLELSGSNISGIIPEELGNLTNLILLDELDSLKICMQVVNCDVLNALKNNTADPNNVLESWDATDDNPCVWDHVTCNHRNSVTRRLNNNSLTGTIPASLTTVMTLQVLDLSNNQLVGDIPVNGSFTLFHSSSFSNNKLNNPPPASPTSSGNSVIGAIFGELSCCFLFLQLYLLGGIVGNDRIFYVMSLAGMYSLYLIFFIAKDPEYHLGQLKRFSLHELQAATDYFSNKHVVGSGGSGRVYKGHLVDGSLVAIKRLKQGYTHGGMRQFQTEVEMVSMAVHRNLLRLRGFCMTATERLLVYPFMVNGSVRSCLRERPESQAPLDWGVRKRIALGAARGIAYFSIAYSLKSAFNLKCNSVIGAIFGGVFAGALLLFSVPAIIFARRHCRKRQDLLRPESQAPLDWGVRKRIALGAARGIAYLHDHCNPKIIHRDLKAADILLDEEFEAVVGDFGLAKLMDYKNTHVTTAVRGTMGHIAPEYLSSGRASEKTDVFGYGIMLLELITGQKAADLARLANDDVMLLDWVEGLLKDEKLETVVDSDLQGNYIKEEVEQLIQVALLCTQSTPVGRPKMAEVVRMLDGDGLAERWEDWQKKKMFHQEFSNTHHPNVNWIITDSTSRILPDELSVITYCAEMFGCCCNLYRVANANCSREINRFY
ncbi:hypothetical protein GOBAR_AA28949 [Gossypium barbadense]|uniref:non-specific serine/threonine protein kinase n=1 Tax=Gossypium barbadense TaxID=3634 RepID=A0A2P5WKX7_GOSBA|nr:hypothetical protein GOBAR_AA28949 [Gossypium barbadense]